MRVASSFDLDTFLPESTRQSDCILSIAHLPDLTHQELHHSTLERNWQKNSRKCNCHRLQEREVYSHLKNSWASSSFPFPSCLPMFLSWDTIPIGEIGDFPSFILKIRPSNSQVKHQSLLTPEATEMNSTDSTWGVLERDWKSSKVTCWANKSKPATYML